MPATIEVSGQEGLNHGRYAGFPLLRRQAADIGVIVLARTASAESIITQCRPYPLYLVSSNAHTNAGATYQNTTVEIPFSHSFSYSRSAIGIVDRITGATAKVLITMPRFSN